MRRRRGQRKPALHTVSKPTPPADPYDQRMRERFMHRFDDLPASIRAALRECPFDVHIGMKNRHWNVEAVVARLQAIRSVEDAATFNQEFAARGFNAP